MPVTENNRLRPLSKQESVVVGKAVEKDFQEIREKLQAEEKRFREYASQHPKEELTTFRKKFHAFLEKVRRS